MAIATAPGAAVSQTDEEGKREMHASASPPTDISPRVFISYSHEGPAHDQKVVDLAEKLREWGVDAWIDRYEPHPAEGWPRWMTNQIETADFVLLVCTETYCRRFEGKEAPDKGKGVTWEGLIAEQVIYDKASRNEKCIAVGFDGHETAIPMVLKPFTHYLLPDGFEDLYRHLTDQPEIKASALGKKRKLPTPKASRKSLPKLAVNSEGAPEPLPKDSPFLPGPAVDCLEAFFGRERELIEVWDALKIRQPVQIIGEARMGKTSFLNRIAADLPADAPPLVQINANDVACASPACLAGEIVNKLERRMVNWSDSAEEIRVLALLKDLAPFTLVLDDADRLAKPGHQFTQSFFSQCRSLCQEGRIMWISASRVDLQIAFRQSGLSSDFLNDSKQIFMGLLEKGAVEKLLKLLGQEAAAKILDQTGGFTLGLQWLGDAWWKRPGLDAERLADEYANAVRPTFSRWWSHRGNLERFLLKRALSPLPKSSLSDKERRVLRDLANRGLAEEEKGNFILPGRVWREHVRDAD